MPTSLCNNSTSEYSDRYGIVQIRTLGPRNSDERYTIRKNVKTRARRSDPQIQIMSHMGLKNVSTIAMT